MIGPDQISRSIQYCEHRAAEAEHPEERDEFLILVAELRKRAGQEATQLAFEMPTRPAALSVMRRTAARKRA
jgi:hypothetical protein